MSVAGIDVGNAASCVALARKRGVDVILNKESNRETPTLVSFGQKQRFIGTDAKGVQATNIKNTVGNLKRLLGKKFKEDDVQRDIKKLPFRVSEAPDGGCLIHVNALGNDVSYTPEAVMGMVLADLKVIAERENNGLPITDSVLSVPVYFTDSERHAMLDAARIANLNCLRLMNDTAATALGYGIYKTDLPDDKPIHVAIVDAGEMALQVCVIALQKGKLRVLSSAWDRHLGGSDFDDVIFDHFVKEILSSKKLDVMSNQRACLRLRMACEKLKKILSTNPEAPLSVECLMEDTDISSHMTREKFDELAAGIISRIPRPLQAALDQAGLKAEDIDNVELIGGSSRVPALFETVKQFFGKEPSRTMNAKECVSRGCSLQCAMLSPIFRVKEFSVEEAVPYTVNFTWEKEPGEPTTSAVFKRGNSIPSTKMLTFYKSEPFTISADYDDDTTANLPSGSLRHIGDFKVGPPIPVPEGQEKAKLKVKVHINLHGILCLESVQAVEETEVEEPPAEEKPASADAENGEKAPEADSKDASAADASAEGAAKEAKKSVRVRKTDVAFTMALPGMSPQTLAEATAAEQNLQKIDRAVEETNERKNALEGYVYDMRNKIYDAYSDFIGPDVKDKFLKQLDDMEEWLYDEGEDAERSVYIKKLNELKQIGEPVEERYREMSTRGPAAERLLACCNKFAGLASGGDPKYAHISDEEKGRVIEECQKASEWLREKQALQESLPKHEVPVLMTHDIDKKIEAVTRASEAVLNKPPPPPPKAEEKPANEDDSAPMDTEGAARDEEAPMETEEDAKDGDAMEN
uniref:Heat shock 70kDa protein 4 n=1 Tax=Tetraselmis sp. GSL018 TaxID=582737 RepID=A0A061S331_9CHLO|mmetsp:Transcript_4446/g.10759  ORF Transcript_4446/g.10759 Transcript_4446/m.10759 type:complete len:808 (-) Transcript_4446:874-3297(-)